jgi:hypothetical protein
MAALYAGLAGLAALDSALASLGLVPWFTGLRWLRTHVVTLGIAAQAVFGLSPLLVAAWAGRPRPRHRWDIWLALNAGLAVLLVGMPLVSAPLMLAGGTLVFIATARLMVWLARLRSERAQSGQPSAARPAPAGQPFYVGALAYLLLGVFLGVGMWLGWGPWLGLANVKEVHVHANIWGFAAMAIAGLIVDGYPAFTGRPLAWPRSAGTIFWLMALGTLGLVTGPWLRVEAVSTIGLAAHTAGSVWLLANIVWPVRREWRQWSPGFWQVTTAYIWLLVPTAVAPLIVVSAPGFPVAELQNNGGPILVYGWLLPLVVALLPFGIARVLVPGERARLGGTWLSLAAGHLGGLFFWPGLFLPGALPWLHAIAFGWWALALVPAAITLRRSLAPYFA